MNPIELFKTWLHKDIKKYYVERLVSRDFDINRLDELVSEKKLEIDRLSQVVNLQTKELEKRSVREYVFDIDSLTQEEQQTLGKFHDHIVVKILKKSFKAKADENCDKIVHFPEESPVKLAQWALAVRVYDDLVLQLKTCSLLK